ncbi:hypothetical protein SAICODRAFT_22406 [Saitoella complicata NRRL Y-17804]|uniref:uncharacterized protein n=1 Tax=Saitoella complicata (strain BCRC 22490 / CBS 7301 / JCM 7358 / NBRC 10748 / NRRL Y-17804) TaxID=698492 RepID=UPI0008680407|nr:uncharacterized protein SAICODRAFT_22406 [Saitoella complicata NRRL Y-17804]ODQ55970.1 hypothetical protein SAICODRAFT_22406 [Saitoella complicata NRRL Y-17804]
MKERDPDWTPSPRVVEPKPYKAVELTLHEAVDIDHVNKELDNLVDAAFRFQHEKVLTASHLLRALNVLCPDCGYTVDHVVKRVWTRRYELAGKDSSLKVNVRRRRIRRDNSRTAITFCFKENLLQPRRRGEESCTPEQSTSPSIDLPLRHPEQVFTEPDSPAQSAPADYSVRSELAIAQSDYTSEEEEASYMMQRKPVVHDLRQDGLVIPDPIFDAYLQIALKQDEERN